MNIYHVVRGAHCADADAVTVRGKDACPAGGCAVSEMNHYCHAQLVDIDCHVNVESYTNEQQS